MTSWMIFSWARLRTVKPMRLAGTCKRYSNKAIPQLAKAAIYQGEVDRFFRCPYQAKVMKTFEANNNSKV